MKTIVKNKDNLKEEDITDFTTKVKVLLFDQENNIFIASSDNSYQFVGGTNEKGESLNETLLREVREETGIILENKVYSPFLLSKSYYKDWPTVGKNKLVQIYYYLVTTIKKESISNLELTEEEIRKNFKIEKIKYKDLEKVLKIKLKRKQNKDGIILEMLEVLKFLKSKKGDNYE